MSGFEHLLNAAAPWLHGYGYAALSIGVLFEGTGIPLPGGVLMGGAALLAGRGEMNVVAVWLTAWLSAMAGDNLGYWIGRNGGRRLLLRAGVKRRRLARFQRFFRRFGVYLIVFGRFFDGTRQLDGLVAGGARMSWPKFFAADLGGTALWVSFWVLGLYSLDRHGVWLHRALVYLNPWLNPQRNLGVATAVLIVLASAFYFLFRRSAPDTGAPHVSKPALPTVDSVSARATDRGRHKLSGDPS
jgi:membrane protein DedA with SNARE-associated domain